MITVELLPAYIFDCPSCGRENTQRSISQILDPEDEEDAEMIRMMNDLDADEPIPEDMLCQVQSRPDRVTCKHCNAEFKAIDMGSQDIESDEEGEDE